MKRPKTKNVDPEKLIPAAIGGNKKALKKLMVCDWLITMLAQISASAGWRFHVDDHELRVFVEEKLRDKIRTIKNSTNQPWCDRLTAWCKFVVRRRGIALAKTRNRQEAYWKRVVEENSPFAIGGKRIMIPRVKTPEEEVMDKEQELLEQRRKVEIRTTAKKVVEAFPARQKRIGKLFLKGKSTKQIIQVTGEPASTVYRILGDIQEAIVEEIGAQEALREQPKLIAGLQKLVGGGVR